MFSLWKITPLKMFYEAQFSRKPKDFKWFKKQATKILIKERSATEGQLSDTKGSKCHDPWWGQSEQCLTIRNISGVGSSWWHWRHTNSCCVIDFSTEGGGQYSGSLKTFNSWGRNPKERTFYVILHFWVEMHFCKTKCVFFWNKQTTSIASHSNRSY